MKRRKIRQMTDAGCAAPVRIMRKRPLTGSRDRINHRVGLNLVCQLRNLPFDFTKETRTAGLRDGITHVPPPPSGPDRRGLHRRSQRELLAQARARRRKAAEKNRSEGAVFLAGNKLMEGIHSLPGGLQYRVLAEGAGPVPTATDVVVLNYRGRLLDGTEFENSAYHAESARFRINQTIRGWAQALCRMKLGAKWELFVPARLAYGARGAGRLIPPNATLIYELELVWIDY